MRCSPASIAVGVQEVTVDGSSSNEPNSAGTVKQKRSVSSVVHSNSAQGFSEYIGW